LRHSKSYGAGLDSIVEASPEPIMSREAKARTPRKVLPPDRFLRAPAYKAWDPLAPRRTGSVRRLDQLDVDDRHRALLPARDRDDAGQSGIDPGGMSRSWADVEPAGPPMLRNCWSEADITCFLDETISRSTAKDEGGAGQAMRAALCGVSPKALHTVHRAHRRSTGSSKRGKPPEEQQLRSSQRSKPKDVRAEPQRPRAQDPHSRSFDHHHHGRQHLNGAQSQSFTYGQRVPRALHRATRETGITQKQESVTAAAVFLSKAARNLEDLDGSRAAPVGTREVVLARQWGLVLVVFQWSFVLLFIIGELASAACLNLAALDLAVCRSVIKA